MLEKVVPRQLMFCMEEKDAQMKKYLIMSLAVAACSVMVSGCAEGGSAGEDTDGTGGTSQCPCYTGRDSGTCYTGIHSTGAFPGV